MITAEDLRDLVDIAAQLFQEDVPLDQVLVQALEIREEGKLQAARVAGLQHIVDRQLEVIAAQAERIRQLERRDLSSTVAAFHQGHLTEAEARERCRPRVINLEPGCGPMRREPLSPWRLLRVLGSGLLAAAAVLALGAWS